jgi:hypothetical protein
MLPTTPQLSITINEFSASEAGPPPFPLERFEALQHSHVRQVRDIQSAYQLWYIFFFNQV